MTETETEIKKHPLADCENCPLKDAHYAPSTGLDKKVAFVSRSPGAYDGRSGIAETIYFLLTLFSVSLMILRKRRSKRAQRG